MSIYLLVVSVTVVFCSREIFFISWFAQHDASYSLQFLIVHNESRIHRVQVSCLFKVFNSFCVPLIQNKIQKLKANLKDRKRLILLL